MKKFYILISIICFIFSSCPTENLIQNIYYKSYFLADTSIDLEGEIFNVVQSHIEIEPMSIQEIVAKTDSIDGWEINGIIESVSKYKLTMNVTSENSTINTESIKISKSEFLGIIPVDFPICPIYFSIDFYINNRSYIQPSYWEPRDYDPQEYYKYDILEYMYVYVTEPFNIFETKTIEVDSPWSYTNVIYYDLNFSKPGWYKICRYDSNYNNNKFINNSKHNSGQNTDFHY